MSCPACFQGGVTTNHPTGIETTIHGLPTYVAKPDEGVEPKGVLVFITDAFGWEFPNNRVLADHYAKKGGLLVYCPDFMDGNAMNASMIELMDKVMLPAPSWLEALWKPWYVVHVLRIAIPWKRKTNVEDTHPPILRFVRELRTGPPPFATENLKIGVAGFCWGGKHAFLLARVAEKMIDCVFTAHPSYLEVPEDADGVMVPVSVVVGDMDMAMKVDKVKKMKEILEGKNDSECEVIILEGAKHGFAVRTHPDDLHEMKCAEKAEEQALKWFEKWLG